MFKSMDLNLSEPICKCKERKLGCSLGVNAIFLSCLTCGTKMTVPGEQIGVNFSFDKPYGNDVGSKDSSELFKHIVIKLVGPICKCGKQNLGWGIGNNRSLFIRCEACKTIVNISRENLTAVFELEKPYLGISTEELGTGDFFKFMEDQMKDFKA